LEGPRPAHEAMFEVCEAVQCRRCRKFAGAFCRTQLLGVATHCWDRMGLVGLDFVGKCLVRTFKGWRIQPPTFPFKTRPQEYEIYEFGVPPKWYSNSVFAM
jgi:hypothetical protein